jgi:hypothetical protein
MSLFFSWFAHNHLITGCKREIPPTKQEIANPYIYKVTDKRCVHYGLYEHFFKFLQWFCAAKMPLPPKCASAPRSPRELGPHGSWSTTEDLAHLCRCKNQLKLLGIIEGTGSLIRRQTTRILRAKFADNIPPYVVEATTITPPEVKEALIARLLLP